MRMLLNQAGRCGLTIFSTFVFLWFTILQNAMAYWSGDRIEQAIIQEGGKLDDPSEFVKRLNSVLIKSL